MLTHSKHLIYKNEFNNRASIVVIVLKKPIHMHKVLLFVKC